MDDNNSCFILIIRHGERSDSLAINQMLGNDLKFSLELDPKLTEKGLLDARLTGEHIKSNFLDKISFDSIEVFSSPFLRCLQTAGQIALAIAIENVTISYGICEKLGFEYCEGVKPFDRMSGCNKKNQLEIEKVIGCKLIYEPEEGQDEVKFPEKYIDCFKRYSNYIDNLIEKQKTSKAKNLIIIVTHGIAIDVCRKKFESLEDILIDYTCISCIHIDKKEDNVKLILNAYNKHVDRRKEFKLSNNLYVI